MTSFAHEGKANTSGLQCIPILCSASSVMPFWYYIHVQMCMYFCSGDSVQVFNVF